MQIGRKDIYWNYAATFLKIASFAILIPFILRTMPSEVVGIWTVFMSITSLSGLLDFGFGPSFTRNVTYIFSGVRLLKVKGCDSDLPENKTIDYGLLKGMIAAMRWFYLRIALVLFLLLSTLGTYYIYTLLFNYKGDHKEVYMAWALLCIINTYNLYTLYYESLLQGKGLVKRSKQIAMIGQLIYLTTAALLILFGYGLVAIVTAQILSVVIVRSLSYHLFFTQEIKKLLYGTYTYPTKELLKTMFPNAVKIGLAALGGFMVQRSAIIIGSLYLSLKEIASYGITMQFIAIISGLAGIYTATYQPKIAELRVIEKKSSIKDLYLTGQVIQVLTYLSGGIALIVLGEWSMNLLGSRTHIMPTGILIMAMIITFLENNHAIAGEILLTNNEVPFFRASLTAGTFTIVLLLAMFLYLEKMGLWAMILAPGIAHLYNNWKWPHEVYKQLNISQKDVVKTVINFGKFRFNEK